MKHRVQRTFLIAAVLLASTVFISAQTKAARSTDAVAMVGQYLKKSPYKVESVSKTIWTLDNKVIVTAEHDYMIAFSILARKADYKPTAEAYSAMLKYAGEADFVKIILEHDGSLVLRIESKTKAMDQKDFDEVIEQVFAATAAAAAKLTPYLVK